MCKEDIRLARAAAPEAATRFTTQSADTRVFGGNPNRYSLTAHILTVPAALGDFNVVVYAYVNGAKWPLLSLSEENIGGHVSLTEVGSILQEEIWCNMGGNSPPSQMLICTTAFDQSLEEIK